MWVFWGASRLPGRPEAARFVAHQELPKLSSACSTDANQECVQPPLLYKQLIGWNLDEKSRHLF